MQRITVRISDELHAAMSEIAKNDGTSLNYRDKRYMDDKATIINEEIISIIQANNALLLQQINNKSNRVLSELSIQNAIQNLILTNELDVDKIDADNYRQQAVEFLKTNNRVLRLDELI